MGTSAEGLLLQGAFYALTWLQIYKEMRNVG